MALRAWTALLALVTACASAQDAAQQLADKNPALYRLNDKVIATAFSEQRNEVVCTYCLLQVVAAAYQIGNDVVRREISDSLASSDLGQLSEALLNLSERRKTLTGSMVGYYQQGVLECPSSVSASRCRTGSKLLRKRGIKVDFTDRDTVLLINEHVQRATNGKISDLFTSLSPDTKLVFASTLVFSDQWPTRMGATPRDFRTARGVVKAPMLVAEDFLPVLDGSRDGVIGVALPYRDPGISLYCFTTENGADIRDQLFQQHFIDLAHAPTQYARVRLPKFDVVSKQRSYQQLVELMGMREMFLAGLGPTDRLKVDQLVHKAIIQTDEDGTTAAGAAAIAFVPLSATPQAFNIEFNKPFICSLVDNEVEVPLFTTYIADPTSA